MPYVQLPSPKNSKNNIAVWYLVGVMLFPESEEKIIELIRAVVTGQYQQAQKIIQTALDESGRAATLSGALLLLTIRTNPNIASLNLSKEALYKGYGNKIMGVSKSTQNAAWKEFNTVAHLWAAQQVFSDPRAFPDMKILPGFPCDESQLSLFLAVAEAFRKQGESFRPLRTRKNEYILDNTKTRKLHPHNDLGSYPEFQITGTDMYPFVRDVFNGRSPRYK